MDQLTAHKEDYTRNQSDLYVAFELGKKNWKLGFTVGFGQKPRQRTILPESKLSRWYRERFGHGGGRLRRIGIVALARKLLIDLWRYLETGMIPEGAELKT